MTRERMVIDISTMPEVARLAEEVARTGQACVLQRGGADVAILSPAHPRLRLRGEPVPEADGAALPSASESQDGSLGEQIGGNLSPAPVTRRRLRGKTVTDEDREAAMAVFGAWKGRVDPEQFKRQRRELQVHDRALDTQ